MSKISDLKKLNTWDNPSNFEYNGSAQEGTKIIYGTGWKTFVRYHLEDPNQLFSDPQTNSTSQHNLTRTIKIPDEKIATTKKN